MTSLSLETWLVLALVAAVGVLAMLRTLAAAYLHETRVHDLKIRVHDLRKSYAHRLAEMSGREIVEVDEARDH